MAGGGGNVFGLNPNPLVLCFWVREPQAVKCGVGGLRDIPSFPKSTTQQRQHFFPTRFIQSYHWLYISIAAAKAMSAGGGTNHESRDSP